MKQNQAPSLFAALMTLVFSSASNNTSAECTIIGVIAGGHSCKDFQYYYRKVSRMNHTWMVSFDEHWTRTFLTSTFL
jgi:hypothetical protein